MTNRSQAETPLAVALGVALLAAILIDWSPRYWRVTVAVAGISLVGAIWAVTARHVSLPYQTVLIAFIAVWGPLQLALKLTRVPWPTTQRSIEWAAGGVCFVLGTQVLRGQRSRDAFLNLMLCAMTVLAVAAMLQMYITPDRVFGIVPVADSVVGTMYYKNWFAAMMELAAPIALWRVYNGKAFSGGLCFAAMFAATITSASRMGVVLVLAELLVALVVMVVGRRMPLKSAVSVVGILTLLVAAASGVAGTDKIWERLREPDAYAVRGTLLASTWKMIPVHPWFGSGLGTWPSEYPGFATGDSGLLVNAAHNDWAQWASEGGVPFFLFMAVLALVLLKPSMESVWGIGVLGVLIHGFVDYPFQDPALACLWFALAGGLTRLHSGRQHNPERPRSASGSRGKAGK